MLLVELTLYNRQIDCRVAVQANNSSENLSNDLESPLLIGGPSFTWKSSPLRTGLAVNFRLHSDLRF